MHPHLSAKAWRAGWHRGNVQNAEASVAHLFTPGPSKGQSVSGRATPPAPCFAIGLLTARTENGAIRGATARKVWSGPNPSSMDKCCRRVLEPPDTGAISREEIVGPVTGIVKDAGDEEAGQRWKAGATPWRDRDFATRPM